MEKVIEAMLFAYGKPIKVGVIANILEIKEAEVKEIIENMIPKYESRGIEIIKSEDSYSLVTKNEYYNQICKLFETKAKPTLSNAAFEVLSIIAYNNNITRAEVEKIRGVNSDGTINRLIEYEIIEESGRLDVPGRPITYKVTENFYKLFGYSSLNELPKINIDGGNVENNEERIVEKYESVEESKNEE